MSLLALAFVFPGAAFVAYVGGCWLDRRETAQPPRQPAGTRYVDSPGFPAPTTAETTEWESDDCLPADQWCAWWPPGSLGHYPDGLPTQPGRLTHDDSLDVIIAASRLTRAAAEQRKTT